MEGVVKEFSYQIRRVLCQVTSHFLPRFLLLLVLVQQLCTSGRGFAELVATWRSSSSNSSMEERMGDSPGAAQWA